MSPLARNLFQLKWPVDVAASIEPPVPADAAVDGLIGKILSTLPNVQFAGPEWKADNRGDLGRKLMAATAAFDAELAREHHRSQEVAPGAALPILHDLQTRSATSTTRGPDDRRALNLSRAEVARRRQLLPRLPPRAARTGAC